MTDELDLIREALTELNQAIRDASMRLSEYVRANAEDPIAYALADRIMVAVAEERRYRRLLTVEVAG